MFSKVVLVAFCMSAYCKSVDLEADDADQDERPPLLFPKSKWRQKSLDKRRAKRTISEKQLDMAKQQRVREKEMW